MAGLGAGCWLKQAGEEFLIVEKLDELPMNLHNGVHYLHTLPELPFDADLKSITLTDGVLKEDGTICHIPNLNDALEYSEKIKAIQHPSSIFEIGDRSKVFVPESNSLNDFLLSMCNYIGQENFVFGAEVCSINSDKKIISLKGSKGDKLDIEYENIVSAAPLGILMDLAPNLAKKPSLFSVPIQITNVKADSIVPNWLINLYVPSQKEKVYRVSILNNIVSVESIEKLKLDEILNLKKLFKMFHLDVSAPKEYEWTQGKIISISIDERKAILEAFVKEDIYTIGRFGLWNNKLLMDSTINQAKLCVDCITEKVGKKELIKKLSI